MSDPRYPSAFQRPGSATQPAADAAPASAPAPAPEAIAADRPRASARSAPAPESAAPERAAPETAGARGGNRIVLLGAPAEDAALAAPASTRNLAIGGLYALAGALLVLALLGGLWSQGMLRGTELFWPEAVNPDGLRELSFDGADAGAVGLARLLVQLAPTTLALGVLALLVAIVLPVLTRRPR